MAEVTNLDEAIQRLVDRGLGTLASEEEIQRFEREQQERDRRDRLEASGITERLDAPGVEAIIRDRTRATRALQLVRAWVASSRPVLVLFGEPGVGKTVAAAWALARLPGRYVVAQELCEMRGVWRERDRYQQLLRSELLVIEELGRERDETEASDTLQDVIDRRQRLPRRTLLLGNITTKELVTRYDRRTLDRLGVAGDEYGIAILRTLKGPSLRAPASGGPRGEGEGA